MAIDDLTKGMDRRTARYKRTIKELEARARPGEVKTVTYKHTEEKNYGLPVDGEIELVSGMCPCAICGHEFMWECDDALCECCSSVCT